MACATLAFWTTSKNRRHSRCQPPDQLKNDAVLIPSHQVQDVGTTAARIQIAQIEAPTQSQEVVADDFVS